MQWQQVTTLQPQISSVDNRIHIITDVELQKGTGIKQKSYSVTDAHSCKKKKVHCGEGDFRAITFVNNTGSLSHKLQNVFAIQVYFLPQ